MAEIINIFSTEDPPPKTHTLESANRLLPLVKKYTEEAIEQTTICSTKIQYLEKGTPPYKSLSKEYDQIIMNWVEKIHRLGALAKGLWLVDFDSGEGLYCWKFPETRVDHYHDYKEGFKSRKRIEGPKRTGQPLG